MPCRSSAGAVDVVIVTTPMVLPVHPLCSGVGSPSSRDAGCSPGRPSRRSRSAGDRSPMARGRWETDAAGCAYRYPWSAGPRKRSMPRVTTTPSSGPTSGVIRVLVVDDHPALRAGLARLLRAETGIECLAPLAGVERLSEAVRDARPDVVVLDYALGRGDGLTACFRLKQHPTPPAVILYSAYVDRPFAVPAAIAQADATIAKSAPVDDLLSAIRG